MKWKRGKKASMEARAKQHAASAAAAAAAGGTDKSCKQESQDTRKQDMNTTTDTVLNVNNAAHARNDYGRRISETGNAAGCKMAVIGSELYARRPTSVIAFSVPPPSKMADEQRACVSDRKSSNLSPFRVMSLT